MYDGNPGESDFGSSSRFDLAKVSIMHQSIAAAPSSGMGPGLENAQSPGSTKFSMPHPRD